MFLSKIPVLSKNKVKRNGSKMEMNAENLYLEAKIQVLEKENNELMEGNLVALQKLAAAENTISLLKADMLLMKESKKDLVKRNQFDVSEMRKKRNKAFNHAQKLQAEVESLTNEMSHLTSWIVVQKPKEIQKLAAAEIEEITKKKDEEIASWKMKYDELESKVSQMSTSANIFEKILFEFNWGQNIVSKQFDNIFEFPIMLSKNRLQSPILKNEISHYLNWVLELKKTEEGLQFLRQPATLEYRSEIVNSIRQRLLDEDKHHPALVVYKNDCRIEWQDKYHIYITDWRLHTGHMYH